MTLPSASLPPAALAASEPTFWMPVRASEQAGLADWLFYFLFYLSLFFFALIVGLMIVFVLRYRRRGRDELARALLAAGSPQPGYIFNLGHGILPPTNPEHAVAMVEAVHRLGRKT